MRILAFLLLSFLFADLASQAQSVKYSNEFMNLGVGARAQGMSNAVLSSTTGAEAGFWNPAGMVGQSSDMEVSLMHAEYFAGIANYDYASISRKISNDGVLGFSFIRFGVDDIPNTTQLISAEGNINYDRVTGFSAADYAFLISYGQPISIDGLSVGGNSKIIRRVVGDFGSSWGFGFDLAAKYATSNSNFALILKDITTTFNMWSFNLDSATRATFEQTGNVIPSQSYETTLPQIILAANNRFVFSESMGLTAEVALFVTTDGPRNVLFVSENLPLSADPALGLEFDYKEVVFLRAGLGNFQRLTQQNGQESMSFQPNMGVGLRFGRVGIDYAFTDVADQSTALFSHVFSFKIGINKN